MKAELAGRVLRVEGAEFDAEATLLDSAQTFHWVFEGGAYYGCADGLPLRVRQDARGIAFDPVSAEDVARVIHYFDLERDYGALAEEFSQYGCARTALTLYPGLRVLNQPAWPVLVMFILSSNNNAVRIRDLTLKLCRAYGARHEMDGVEFYDLPPPDRLAGAGEAALRALGCGYRAKYLMKTAGMVRDGFPLEGLREMSYEQAHERLVELPGVGDKVADCVQLFGLQHSQAFPVDTWVDKLLRSWFAEEFAGFKGNRRRMAEAARQLFGPRAGLLQQYLFHCARKGRIAVGDNKGDLHAGAAD